MDGLTREAGMSRLHRSTGNSSHSRAWRQVASLAICACTGQWIFCGKTRQPDCGECLSSRIQHAEASPECFRELFGATPSEIRRSERSSD